MAGKQAKLLTDAQVRLAIGAVRKHRYPERDIAILELSVKGGLRACEISALTWKMVQDVEGRVSRVIELHDAAAKKRSGRAIPINPELRRALIELCRVSTGVGYVICSERAERMLPGSIVNWFARLYRELGFIGASSHSGRRTFITRAARLVSKVGGSLRDVQQLAGHSSIDQTQRYIEGDTDAKRRLVAML